MSLTNDECYESANKYCACVEFRPDDDLRHGFSVSQLIAYTLESNPDAGDNREAPPQKLLLAFSTANVVILGWRLGRLADSLRENNLAVVRAHPRRNDAVDHKNVFVTSIRIAPIEKK
jgi:hypothetical protein